MDRIARDTRGPTRSGDLDRRLPVRRALADPPSIGQHVEAAGLRAAFTQIPGIALPTSDPWRLPRLGVSARDDFYLKLSGVLDWPLWKRLLGRTT